MVDSAVEDKHILAQCRAKLFYSGELLEDIEKDAIIDQTESTIISVALLHQGCSILLYAKDDVQGKVEFLVALSEVHYKVCHETRHVVCLPDKRKIGLLFRKDTDFDAFFEILKLTIDDINSSKSQATKSETFTRQLSEPAGISSIGNDAPPYPTSLPVLSDLSAAGGRFAVSQVCPGVIPSSDMASGVSGTSSIPVTIKTVSRIVGGLADLTQKLQRAISAGDVVQAQQVATLLAEQHANVSLNVQMEGTPRSNLDKDIQVKVYVEDRESSGVCIGLTLKPSMTIEQLKNKMMLEYSFIPEVQRWIIGKKIVKDTDTLARCGVRGNDMPVFLYLVSAASIGLTPEETRRKYGHLLPHLLPQVCNIPAATSQVPTVEPLPAIAAQRSPTIPPLPPVEQPRLQERQTPERAQTTNEAESDSSNGWVCGKCTYITLWTREACDMCHTDRPANLHPPVNYKIPVDEQRRLEHLEELERLAKQAANQQPEQPGRAEASSGMSSSDQLELQEKDLDLMLQLFTEHMERNRTPRSTSSTTLSVESTGAGRDMPDSLSVSDSIESNDQVPQGSTASASRQIGFESDLETDVDVRDSDEDNEQISSRQ